MLAATHAPRFGAFEFGTIHGENHPGRRRREHRGFRLHGARKPRPKVKAYYDGAAGLAALEADPPDLAILDVKMPRMDGMEVLRRLRQTTDLPVIILTSKDEEIDEILGFNLGADDYIHKPFSQRLLIERVKAVLRRARADGGRGHARRAPRRAAPSR